MKFNQQKVFPLYIVLSIVLYCVFAYGLVREDFMFLTMLYLTLFTLFGLLYKLHEIDLKWLLFAGVLFRLVFLIAIPNLSQDFYRFLWDGRMLFEGLNPYLTTPESFIESGRLPVQQAKELYQGMGQLNASHHTNYPPASQLVFYLAALLSGKSILGSAIVMRLAIILADIGIMWFGIKLLSLLNLPKRNMLLYAINPFVVIELTGNLHFEAIMLFFLVWSLYLLMRRQWLTSAALLGLSVATKLIPLLFLPLFFQWFKTKRNGFMTYVMFCVAVIITFLLAFAPFFSIELIENFSNSVGLWFNKFEFNASVYYLAREMGYLFRGYNEIAVIGKILPITVIIFLAIISLFRNNKTPIQLMSALLIGLTFYYFTTTTMHPWYISTLLILCVFTNYRFPVVWSIVIILSYQAYANTPWQENLWFVAVEYLLLFGYFFWEIRERYIATSQPRFAIKKSLNTL